MMKERIKVYLTMILRSFLLENKIFKVLEKLKRLSKIVKRTLNRELKLELKLSSYKFILTVCVRAPSAPVEAFP